MTGHRKRTFLLAGVVAAAALFASVLAKGRAPHPEAPPGNAAPIAPVALVRKTPIRTTLTLSGEFRPSQEVDLHAKVAGYIRTISVDVGDRVHAGQVLAELEVPELVAQLQEAGASLERARSTHEASHQAYVRLKQASDQRPGLIAAQEIDDAYARDRASEAQVTETEAAERRASAFSAYSKIVAPFSGVVTKRYADTGALIQAGTSSSTQALPVVRLAEDSRLRLVLPVPESAVRRIHVGTLVDVRVPALDRTFQGRVARFSDSLDRATRTMETEIDVGNADGTLVPGMYAETELELLRKDGSLTVPIQAVSRNGKDATVLVVGPGNRVEERAVQIGVEGARRLEIAGGLSEGDRVVVGSRSQFRPGEPVEPRPIEEPNDAAEGGL